MIDENNIGPTANWWNC